MYADINGDGVINQQDMTHVGSPIPTLTGGLNLSFDYKGIDFSLFFQGAYAIKFIPGRQDIEGFYRPLRLLKDITTINGPVPEPVILILLLHGRTHK